MKVKIIPSPHRLNLFNQCPFKLHCYVTKKPKIKEDERYADFGTIVHSVIEQYFREIMAGQVEISKYEIRTRPEEILKEMIEMQRPPSEFMPEFYNCIQNFINFELQRFETWDKYEPDRVEWRLPNNSIIDFFSTSNGGIIIDWKTNRRNMLDDKMRVQGKIYEYIVRKMRYPVNKVLFVMLSVGTTLELPRIDDSWLHQQVDAYWNIMNDEKKILQLKNKGTHCLFCPYYYYCLDENPIFLIKNF